jgi:pimeloyl-ACP methyl ester carboxylesterase
VPVLTFEGCELDRQRFELRRGGARAPVEPQVFDVLTYLVTHRERVVSRGIARRGVGHPLRGPVHAVHQEIRICRSSDGVRLADATHGDGPVLVKVANWLTHLDHDWRSPLWRHWLHELGARHRLVRYDERGCGLSDRDVQDFSLDAWVRDLEAVLDDLQLERVPLLGISQGAAVAIAYAVAHPERVSHLVLYGSYALGPSAVGQPMRYDEEAGLVIELTKVAWGRRNAAFRQLFTASFVPAGNAEQWRAFDELQRESTSAANAARFLDTLPPRRPRPRPAGAGAHARAALQG